MSVKFEKDTIKKGVEEVKKGLIGEPLPGTSGKHPISEAIGTAITGGKKNAGSKGYLAVRLPIPPLRSVMCGRYDRIARCTMVGSMMMPGRNADAVQPRPTSSSSSRTLCAPRCSLLELSPVLRS